MLRRYCSLSHCCTYPILQISSTNPSYQHNLMNIHQNRHADADHVLSEPWMETIREVETLMWPLAAVQVSQPTKSDDPFNSSLVLRKRSLEPCALQDVAWDAVFCSRFVYHFRLFVCFDFWNELMRLKSDCCLIIITLQDIKELQARGAIAGVFPGQVGSGYSSSAPSAQPEMKTA